MRIYKLIIYLIITLNSIVVLSQSKKAIELEKIIISFNDQTKYTQSIASIDTFILNNKNNEYDLYYAYLLKSYTYKRLFDYDNVIKCLNLSLKEGLQSDKKEEVIAVINAEKSFVFFDLQQYEKSSLLMNEIEKNNYAFLDNKTKSYLIMQEGYLFFLTNDFINSELKYDKAIGLMENNNPKDLPIVYGKKVLLYSKMNQIGKLKQSFNLGIFYAKKFNLIKYQMYMYEVYRNQFEEKKDFKNAFFCFSKFDSLSTIYNTEKNKSNIKIFEKDSVLKQKEFEIKRNNLWLYFMSFILLILAVFIILIVQFYRIKRSKHIMLENEYKRIHAELTILSQKLNDKNDFKKYNLKERQLEVVDLLRKGKSNKQIAEELFISENTVKYHLKAIYDILQIDNRLQLFKIFDAK